MTNIAATMKMIVTKLKKKIAKYAAAAAGGKEAPGAAVPGAASSAG